MSRQYRWYEPFSHNDRGSCCPPGCYDFQGHLRGKLTFSLLIFKDGKMSRKLLHNGFLRKWSSTIADRLGVWLFLDLLVAKIMMRFRAPWPRRGFYTFNSILTVFLSLSTEVQDSIVDCWILILTFLCSLFCLSSSPSQLRVSLSVVKMDEK